MQQIVTPKSLIAENKRRDYGRVQNHLKSYPFWSIYSRVRSKITWSYSFRSIYPRVRTRITPSDTNQPKPYCHLDTPLSPKVSVGMIIRYASHNLIFIYSTNTNYFKECPKVSTRESRKRVPTPMHRFMGGTHKLVTKTYIKWHVISHCHHR